MLTFDYIAPTLVLAGLAVLARMSQKSWLAPGAFFSLAWIIQVVASYLAPDDYFLWHGAIWYIVAACFALYLGTLVESTLRLSLGTVTQKVRDADPNLFRKPAFVLTVCFLMGTGYTVVCQIMGIELGEIMARPPMIYQALLPFHYAGPMLGGMIFSAGTLRGWRRWLTAAPLLPPASLALLYTGRTAIIAPILFWIAGFFAIEVLLKQGRARLFTLWRVTAAVLLLLLFIGVGMGIELLREARSVPGLKVEEKAVRYQEAATWEAFLLKWRRVRFAIVGEVSMFSSSFIDAWRFPQPPHGGSIIFAAPLDLFGLGGERYPFEAIQVEPGRMSNVFTMLRPPIDDFTIGGSLVWWFLIGIAQGWAYSKVRRGSLLPCVLLIWFYVDVMIVGGFFFRYNAIIMAYGMVGLYLLWSRRSPSAAETSAATPNRGTPVLSPNRLPQ